MAFVMFLATFGKQQAFQRADGMTITHGAPIQQLLTAIHLPTSLAITKYPAHQKTNTLVAQGNNFANKLAKTAALPHCVMAPVVAEEPGPTADLSSLIQAQEEAGVYEKSVWLKRGAIKNQQDSPHKELWWGPSGHFCCSHLCSSHSC